MMKEREEVLPFLSREDLNRGDDLLALQLHTLDGMGYVIEFNPPLG